MPDDNTKRGQPYRDQIGITELYIVSRSAKEFGLSVPALQGIVQKVGHSESKIAEYIAKNGLPK